jgi:hypothetical protein
MNLYHTTTRGHIPEDGNIDLILVNLFLLSPVTESGSPYGCETSRLPHFLDDQLTYGGEDVSLTRRPPFTSKKIPGTHFY